MQTLDIISVNVWQIVISLCNLLLIFLILRKFLYAPVRKILAERKAAVEATYENAARAEADAVRKQEELTAELAHAHETADGILAAAEEDAKAHSRAILEEARGRADRIVRKAESDAELERRKAEDGMKEEIVVVSTALAEKLLSREVSDREHHAMIDDFLDSIGEHNDRNQ